MSQHTENEHPNNQRVAEYIPEDVTGKRLLQPAVNRLRVLTVDFDFAAHTSVLTVRIRGALTLTWEIVHPYRTRMF